MNILSYYTLFGEKNKKGRKIKKRKENFGNEGKIGEKDNKIKIERWNNILYYYYFFFYTISKEIV